RGGDAGGVVVGGVEQGGFLLQVVPDQQAAARADERGDPPEEAAGVVRVEVADGRPGEVRDAPAGARRGAGRGGCGDRELARVIGADGQDLDVGVGRREPGRGAAEVLAGDVHRHVRGDVG